MAPPTTSRIPGRPTLSPIRGQPARAATRALAPPAYLFDEQTVRAMAARDQVSGVRDTAAQSRQAGAKWHGGRLSQLRVPALVLHGSGDPLLRPAAARHTAKAISG